jgi:hypothetical protein
MKLNWIFISALLGLIGGGLTYILTGHWQLSMICGVLVVAVTLFHNPITRYLRAFYLVTFPLLSNVYFTIDSKTENFDVKAGLQKLDLTTTIILGGLAITCLILDYLERSNKLELTWFSSKKNKVGNINGNNNHIQQSND